MNFDFGDVLRHAWQITWKHKVLWIFSALPTVLVIFYLPFLFYLFLSNDFPNNIPTFLSNPTFLSISFVVVVFTATLSFVLQVFSRSAMAFGILRIEEGETQPTFAEISQGGRTFFWRILGAMLLLSLGMMALFTAFSACLSVIGLVTFGIGSLLGQLLFLPATLLFYALTEQTQAASVVDALNPTEAIEHAWALVTKNIGIFALVAVVLYFGFSIVSSLMMVPVMASLFIVVLNRFYVAFSDPAILWIAMLCFVVFLPVYLIFQAGAVLYMKSVFMVTYLRLTRSLKLQPLPETAQATS